MMGIKTNSRYVLALDVGGTNIRSALVDKNLNIISMKSRNINNSSSEALMEEIIMCADETLYDHNEIAGIGVAMKGYVDYKKGEMVNSSNLGLHSIPVKDLLVKRYNCQVYVDNDVHTAALGELFYGIGKRIKNFIYINVGTGVAVGLVFNGNLYRGACNLSGEFGHMTVDKNGPLCSCGMSGCLEEVVSGPAICRRLVSICEPGSIIHELHLHGKLDASKVFSLAEAKNPEAEKVVEETVCNLGLGIVNLINLLNPQAVVLGGGVFTKAESFVGQLSKFVKAYSLKEAVEHLELFQVSELSTNKIGLLGAAGLIFEQRR
jgi:glucokinase-like ROK family protein